MTERPIIFKPHEVRAALNGGSQFRRAMKPQPEQLSDNRGWKWRRNGCLGGFGSESGMKEFYRDHCPYGTVGDRLWVRETWMPGEMFDYFGDPEEIPALYVLYKATNDIRPNGVSCEEFGAYKKCYCSAEEHEKFTQQIGWEEIYGDRWRPSIHMPRWASRLLLEVTDARVERVQDISEADAMAEGLSVDECAAVFNKAAGQIVPDDDSYWVEDHEGNGRTDGDLCRACAESIKQEDDYLSRGCTPELDGPAFCDLCGRPITMSLTRYGIDSLLFLDDPSTDNRKYFPVKDGEAAVLAMIAEGIGDLRDEHKGRLAQIGFATLWDSINAKRPKLPMNVNSKRYARVKRWIDNHPDISWAANPWVWVVTFKRVEEPANAD